MNPAMALEVKKTRLKNEITFLEQLKNSTSIQLENIDEINENDKTNYSFMTDNSQDEATSLLRIKNDLLKFAGQRCIKSAKDEYVFEFSAKGDDNKQINYFVQLLKTKSDLRLGKWSFPMFLDVKDIWNEIPAIDVDNLSKFLRKCKHYIDCYHQRMNQFTKCQNSMNKYSNCNINRDQGYRYFMIELFQVYYVKMGNYLNIVAYLQYNLEEIRPFKIKVESQYDGPLPTETEKDLKSFLKPFKHFDLTYALETVEYKDNPLFSWQRVSRDTTLMNDMDLDEISPQRNGSLYKYRNKTKKSSSFVPKNSGQSEKNQVEITKYFKKPKNAAASKKDRESATEEYSEQIFTKNPSPVKKMTLELKRVETNVKDTKGNKNKPLTKRNKSKIPGERRVLRSSPNSPKKGAKVKKTSPEIVGLFLKSSSKSDSNQSRNSPKKTKPSSSSSPEKDTSPKENTAKKLELFLKPSSSSAKKDTSPQRNSPEKLGLVLKPSSSSAKKDTAAEKNSPKKIGISLRSSPRKGTNSKKTSPKKSGIVKKSVTTKATHSKKLENLKKLVSSKTTVSPATSNVKLKQISLQVQKIDKSILPQKESVSNLNPSKTVSMTKMITSTPHPGKVKRPRQSLVDFNVSEIKKSKNTRVAKAVAKAATKQTSKKQSKAEK